jgi:membrane fusion protein, multidrug efflux system
VTGYLEKVLFKDGADVKKGDALFIIDPKPYQVALDHAQALLKSAEAQRDVSKRNLDRLKTSEEVIPPPKVDDAEAVFRGAAAQVDVAKAMVASARLNLDWTTIRAPIDGRISRVLVDPGNLVKGDDTLLAILVNVDSVYVYFDVDERTLLRFNRLAKKEKATPIAIGLGNEAGFPLSGVCNFIDNQVAPATGTVSIRAILPNKERSLLPGMFACVRLPIGAPYTALLLSEGAIVNDQGQKFVYVVDDGNKVMTRTVTLGAKHDGLRVVEKGLTPDDRIIVEGLQRIRVGQTVKPATRKR